MEWGGEEVKEGWDVAPSILAMEANECGLFVGDYSYNVSSPETPAEEALVAQGLRLPTGEMHQCPCALQGRSHLVNGTTRNVYDWAAVEGAWGPNYTSAAEARAAADEEQLAPC